MHLPEKLRLCRTIIIYTGLTIFFANVVVKMIVKVSYMFP